MPIVVATRSDHKLEELRQLVGSAEQVDIVSLSDLGLPASPEEESIEAFDSFEANALAKARYFCRRTGHAVLADDSGLCVDALDGAPGVFSKRFSGRTDLTGLELDLSNNRHLLDSLATVENCRRDAHYVCVIALVTPRGDKALFRGTVHGRILERPRGEGGFGYDPLFFVPELDRTFAEVPQVEKNRISHRANAVRAALPRLRQISSSRTGSPS
ncbi:MAG: RdgB/HAM1 family non-canonical purine NTP pyrophosphatase [Gemmatimonadota bacterium]